MSFQLMEGEGGGGRRVVALHRSEACCAERAAEPETIILILLLQNSTVPLRPLRFRIGRTLGAAERPSSPFSVPLRHFFCTSFFSPSPGHQLVMTGPLSPGSAF